jgi:hypothetical protein
VLGAGSRAAQTKEASTARLVIPPGARSFAVSDLIASMPLSLKTGGIELTFLQNRKVRLGVVVAGEVARFKALKLLGRTVPLDATRIDTTAPPPAPVARAPAAPFPGFRPAPAFPMPGVRPPGARPGPLAPELPLDVKPGPGGRVPEVYRYRPANGIGVPSRNIRVFDQNNGVRQTTARPGGSIGYAIDGRVRTYGVDVLGSTGIQVVVNHKRGYTTVAGLRFRGDATINLWREGVVEVSRVGVVAQDEDGARYVARVVTINGRRVIAMVKSGKTR